MCDKFLQINYDMVKQLLLQNIYEKKWSAQPRARKPPVSFSLEMW